MAWTNAPRVLLLLLLFSFVAAFASCGTAHSQRTSGGNSLFSGHYIFSSIGKFPGNLETYFEDGTFDADGNGHAHLNSAWINGVAGTSNVKGGTLDDNWTYSITNFHGTATSENGDHAYLFCTETGKVCQMIANSSMGWSWSARFERE